MDSDTRSVFEENDPDNGNMIGVYDIQNAYREADTVRLRPVIAAVVEKAMRDWPGPFGQKAAVSIRASWASRRDRRRTPQTRGVPHG